jgi:hypothetical protein
MTSPNLTGDSGVSTAPTARATVFPTGTPAASPGNVLTGNNGATGDIGPTPGTDYGIGTATSAGANTRNPICYGMTNPPSASSDPGSN